MMSEQRNQLTFSKISIILVFVLLSLAGLAAFLYYLADFITGVTSQARFIVFNQGAMILFGVSLLSGLLVLLMVYEITEKKVSSLAEKLLTNAFYISFILIFAVPIVLDIIVDIKMHRMGYVFCEEQSHLDGRAIEEVYAVDVATCADFEE